VETQVRGSITASLHATGAAASSSAVFAGSSTTGKFFNRHLY